MSHSSLEDYYQVIHDLEFHHKYSASDIESWIVFERDIKVDMIIQYLENKRQNEHLEQ